MSAISDKLDEINFQISELTRLKALLETNLEIMQINITTETFRQMVTKVLDVEPIYY